ncbi:unnamed protein product [Amoebophrya sp. A25]|nr:unnamed protein product [Amoebophrya sp. A25]|eukprot:GSA25T00024085001.1
MLEPPLAEMSAESNEDRVEASNLLSTQVRLCVRNGLSGEELALEKSVRDMRTTTLKDVREAIASAIRAARSKRCSKANESGGLEGSSAGGGSSSITSCSGRTRISSSEQDQLDEQDQHVDDLHLKQLELQRHVVQPGDEGEEPLQRINRGTVAPVGKHEDGARPERSSSTPTVVEDEHAQRATSTSIRPTSYYDWEGEPCGGKKKKNFRCFWEHIVLMSVDDERNIAEGEETFLIDQLAGNIAEQDQAENDKGVEQALQVENAKSVVEMEQREQNHDQKEDLQDERTRRGHEPEPLDERRGKKHDERGAKEGERDEGEHEQGKTQTRLRIVVIEYYFREKWKAFESREELDEALTAYLQFWKDCDCYWIDSDCPDRYRDRWEKHIGPGTKLAKYGPLRIWDLSKIGDLSNLFARSDRSRFNLDISGWDVSGATDMRCMFQSCCDFDQDISAWDVSRVRNMEKLFESARSFNRDLGNWNVSMVRNMSSAFCFALRFCGWGLRDWNVGKAEAMERMFAYARSFNEDVGTWNTESLENMSHMFCGAAAFNQPIGGWNVSKVARMDGLFHKAYAFNQPLNDWDTGSVRDLSYCFAQAKCFNQPLAEWDLSAVKDVRRMFFGAEEFNQPLDTWDVSRVKFFAELFRDATSFHQSLKSWDVFSARDMRYMFAGANSFDPSSILQWELGKIEAKRLESIFTDEEKLIQTLSAWGFQDLSKLLEKNEETLIEWGFKNPDNGRG